MAVEKGWGNHKTEMAVGTGRNGWMGTLGDTVCLMGLIVYFLALSPQSLGNAPPHTLRTLQESEFVFILVKIEKNETMHS